MNDIGDQILRVKEGWNPSSPSCVFTHYFYNKVPAEQAHLYQMPPGSNQQKWDKALAARPDASSVPVLAVGFSDLEKRKAQQESQVNAFRVRMHEISDKLRALNTRHELHSTVRLTEMRSRHTALSARILRLAVRLQLEGARGRSLTPDEELYTQKLRQLAQAVQDPSKFGNLTECWARVQSFTPKNQDDQPSTLSWESDSAQMQQIADILLAQQQGIKFLAELLEEDLKVADGALGAGTTSSSATTGTAALHK